MCHHDRGGSYGCHLCRYLPAVIGCYFTRDPKSPALTAKAHGRVSIIVKVLELALSVVYSMDLTFGIKSRLVGA